MIKPILKYLIIGILFLYVFTVECIAFNTKVQADSTTIEEGTYSIDYVILRAEDDSVSIANDYFEKPANLIVQDGEQYIQFLLNHSQWTKELQAPQGDAFVDVDVVEEDEAEDTRLVQFKVDRDLSEPVEFKMHVLIETMDPVYDHRYTVRFDFNLDSLEETESKEVFKKVEDDQDKAPVNDDGGKEQQDDKSTSTISITLAITLLITSVLFVIVLWRTVKK
ncbi:NEAT domain-containing protein [Pseudogracilibacillus sp. SE30717A]|uniref:NEAT domain-containing protein n=1 Tax=Pseudogracilibacillus sp. SE30717A TaxID=3098293 RepID=UPI00300E5018